MKKLISYLILCVCVPLTVFAGSVIFGEKQYSWLTLCVVVLSFIPLFLSFENKSGNTKKLILIAAMVALSVIGRMIFTPIPGFKPVTAMVVITAMYFDGEAGFITGVLSAVISNFYFGQGPWTPFQMFSWGILGLIAGALAEPLKRSKILLAIYAVFSGILYSMLMDIWTVLWADGYFNIKRYIAAIISAGQFTAIYAVSNLIFLLIFAKPIGRILERIKIKYGL